MAGSTFKGPIKIRKPDGSKTTVFTAEGAFTGDVQATAGSIGLTELATAVAPSHVVKFAANYTTVGGAAAEAITVTGAAATDIPIVTMQNDGTGNVTIVSAVVTTNTLTVTFSGNPGNDAIISYVLLRATA